MKLLILSCLIATTFALPTAPPAAPQAAPQARGIKEDIANAASNLAQNYNDIKNEVQNQISNLPQQISDAVAPIQQAVGPITETQDSYHITFVVPKPQLPSWFPSLPSSSTIQLGSLSDYIPNFLKPRGRYPSGVYGNGQQNARNIFLENYLDDNAAEEPGAYIIVLALPNALNWLQYASSNLTPYNNANDARL